MKKVITYILLLVLFFFIGYVFSLNAHAEENPSDEISKELREAFKGTNTPGVNCGVADTIDNKCCKPNSLESAITNTYDSLIENIKADNDKAREFMSDQDNVEGVVFGVCGFESDLSCVAKIKIYAEVLSDKEKLKNLSGNEKKEYDEIKNKIIEGLKILRSAELKDLKDDGPLELYMRQHIDPENSVCLIKIMGRKAFCARGIAEGLGHLIDFVLPDSVIRFFNLDGKSEAEANPCVSGKATKDKDPQTGTKTCTCVSNKGTSPICTDYMRNTGELRNCTLCGSNGGIWTGLGCIQTSPAGFIGSLLSLGLGIAGMVAFICILYASFMFQTSRGNPERIKKAREYLTNCIVGLLLIIFSLFILQFIGVSVLKIPGFLK